MLELCFVPVVRCSLVLVVLTAESWGLLIGGVFMDAKTAQVGVGCGRDLCCRVPHRHAAVAAGSTEGFVTLDWLMLCE